MTLDKEYYTRIHSFINKQDNAHFKIVDLTDDPEKLIFHLKYYIANKKEDDLIIELIDNDSAFTIPEFFESLINAREALVRKIVETFDLVELKKDYDNRKLTNEPIKVPENYKPYKAPGLFK